MPPPPAESAARELAERELWPEPGGLRGLTRRLLGRPSSTGTDELTMRADAERVARMVVDDELNPRTQRPASEPHPGLLNLVRRSESRCNSAVRRLIRQLTTRTYHNTAAQVTLNGAMAERERASQAFEQQPDLPPEPPLGHGLTRARSVWPLLILVMIPIEAGLTYQQLQVLNMSDNKTAAFAALIGISIALVAEVLGLLLYYTFTQEGDDGDERGRSPFYWLTTGFAVLILVVAGFTLWRLADARENNQTIVEERNQRAAEAEAKLATDGFAATDAPKDDLDKLSDAMHIDLGWTFALQSLVLLAATGVSLRKRMAEEYNAVATERQDRRRAARTAERRVLLAERRVAKARGGQDAAQRAVRLAVENERAFLLELFERVRAVAGENGAIAPVALPELEPIDDIVVRAIAPAFPRITQPEASGLPRVVAPPPAYHPPRVDASTENGAAGNGSSHGAGWGATPIVPEWNRIPGIGYVWVPPPGYFSSPTAGPIITDAPPIVEEPPDPPSRNGTPEPLNADREPIPANGPGELEQVDEPRTTRTGRRREFDPDLAHPGGAAEPIPDTTPGDPWPDRPAVPRFVRLAPPNSADTTSPFHDALARIDQALGSEDAI